MLWHIRNTAMGHHGANSRLANGIMPETRTLSACLQPQVLQVHGFHLVSLLLLLIFLPTTGFLLAAGGVMQSVKGPGHRPHDQCCPRGPLRRPWCIGRTVRFGCHVKYVNSVLQFLCVFLLWHEYGPKSILLWSQNSKCLEPKFRI